MDEILASDAFRKFAILSTSEEVFIQAGNDWQPDEGCRTFMQAHDWDPWVLEYRCGGQLFLAVGHVTLDQVLRALKSYLADGSEWRTGFEWGEGER